MPLRKGWKTGFLALTRSDLLTIDPGELKNQVDAWIGCSISKASIGLSSGAVEYSNFKKAVYAALVNPIREFHQCQGSYDPSKLETAASKLGVEIQTESVDDSNVHIVKVRRQADEENAPVFKDAAHVEGKKRKSSGKPNSAPKKRKSNGKSRSTVGTHQPKSKPPSLSPSAKAANAQSLKEELAKYGMKRRLDSTLCDAYVEGTAGKTAEEVAIIMCRMKYLYEGYCKDFERQLSRVSEEIEEKMKAFAEREAGYSRDPFSDFAGYFPGIRSYACEEVTGGSSFGEYKRDLADRWTEFPSQWPWMKSTVPEDDKGKCESNGVSQSPGQNSYLADLPDGVLLKVATFLNTNGVVLLAAALATPSLDGSTSWQKEQSVSSKALIRACSVECQTLDLVDVEKGLANYLSDDDIGDIFVCTDAINNLKRLTLNSCENVTGRGLEPLAGSLKLEKIDLSEVQEYGALSAVLSIIESIVKKDNNSLTHLQFGPCFPETKQMLNDFLAKHGQGLHLCEDCDKVFDGVGVCVTQCERETCRVTRRVGEDIFSGSSCLHCRGDHNNYDWPMEKCTGCKKRFCFDCQIRCDWCCLEIKCYDCSLCCMECGVSVCNAGGCQGINVEPFRFCARCNESICPDCPTVGDICQVCSRDAD